MIEISDSNQHTLVTIANLGQAPNHWKWDQRAVSDLGHAMIACGHPVHRFLLILEIVEQFFQMEKFLHCSTEPAKNLSALL